MIILFLLSYILYFLSKGILVKKKYAHIVLFILTILLFLLTNSIALNFEGIFEIILRIILLISIIDYLLFVFGNRGVLFEKIFSIIYIKNEDIKLKYNFFKPIFLIFYNFFAFIKNESFMGFNDDIVIEISSQKNNDKVDVFIKI